MSDPKPSAQLTFDLGTRSASGRADFLVAPCNREAIGWIDRWPDWPATALVIHGPPGSGKSHLVEVWRALSHATRLDAPSVELETARAWSASPGTALPYVAVEDVRAGFDERALLHLLNTLAEQGGHLLLTARMPAARWHLALPDLASRLSATPGAELGQPDDVLLGALITKLLADRQIAAPREVVSYLVPRVERSFAAAQLLVEALDAASLAERRAITIPLARAVLEAHDDG